MSMTDAPVHETGRRLHLDEIKADGRHRIDMGDIDALADSIASVGLLNPVVVTSDYRLIAGARRIEAVRRLGHPTIQVTIATDLGDAVAALSAERDENTCRKDFTMSELVAIGRQLEELERPKARERQSEAGSRAAPGRPAESSDRAIGTFSGDTREVVGRALGVSGATYERAKRVVEAAEDEALPASVRTVAREAIAEMDAGGSVQGANEKVRRAKVVVRSIVSTTAEAIEQRKAAVRDLADSSLTSEQIAEQIGVAPLTVRQYAKELGVTIQADKVMGNRGRTVDSNRIVDGIIAGVEREASPTAQNLINWSALDPERVADWVSSLDQSIKALGSLRRKLKELTQ